MNRSIREDGYGKQGLTIVDRLGVYLSKRMILRNLPTGSSTKVLDCGCGYHATHLRTLRPYVASGVGIDVSINDACKQVAGLTFVEDTVESALPTLRDDDFDLVLLNSVLEHLSDPPNVLCQCYRVLRPEGVLLINVPTWRGKTFLELSAFRLGTSPACEMDDHKMYYDLRDLWPVLVQAGFKPSRIRLRYHKFGLNLFGVVRK